MKTYFLLREIKESGPFELEELKALNLQPFDLIWIEGESKGWSYPGEINELSSFVCEKKTSDKILYTSKQQSKNFHGQKRVFVSMPSQYIPSIQKRQFTSEEVELETKYSKPLEEIKELYVEHITQKKSLFNNKLNKPNALWLIGLFGSLIFGAVVVKKIVDGLDDNYYQQPTAASIIPIEEYKNPAQDLPQATEAIALDTVVEEKPKVKKLNLTKMVSVEENDFTVGVFGGINDLKLTLHNHSPYELDKVIVNVEYLKPNGEVINSNKIEVISINPDHSKTIKVPGSKRGVDVRTKISKVSSKKYKAALLQL